MYIDCVFYRKDSPLQWSFFYLLQTILVGSSNIPVFGLGPVPTTGTFIPFGSRFPGIFGNRIPGVLGFRQSNDTTAAAVVTAGHEVTAALTDALMQATNSMRRGFQNTLQR